uniref:PCI domain-containing protein n=1 Tax=Peronospora matthiolae TaxID=2874970 RepID=A0AAV1T0M7_9STRA
MLQETLSLVKSSASANLSVAYSNQVETLVSAGNESLADGRMLLLAVAHVLDQSPGKELKVLSALDRYLGSVLNERETDKKEVSAACGLYCLLVGKASLHEQWVVRAITAGLVSAKIDQLARTVTISHSLQRRFWDEQWNEMHEKLQSYKKNVGGLLDGIRNARRAQKAQ